MRLGSSRRYRSSVSTILSTSQSRVDKATALNRSVFDRSAQALPSAYIAWLRREASTLATSAPLVFKGVYGLLFGAGDIKHAMHPHQFKRRAHLFGQARSEERRVGKE